MFDNTIDISQGFYPYGLPPLMGLITTLGLALLAFIKGKGKKSNMLFASLCTIGFFLNLDTFLLTIIKDGETALKISRYDHILLVYNIPIYLHFVYSFLSIKKREFLIPLAYTFSFAFMFFTQSDLYLNGIYKYNFGFFAKGGPIFFLFILINSLTVIYCLYLFYRGLKEDPYPIKRNKIKYIFLGLGLYAILALFNFFPMIGIGIYPIGNFGFVPMIILAFAVLKHNLLDIELLIRRGIVYSVLTTILTVLYACAIVVFDIVFKKIEFSESLLFPVFFFLAIVFFFTPLKERVQKTIDKLFFKGKYDYQKTLRDISQAMTSILDMDEIIQRIIDAIVYSMKVKAVSIFLWDPKEEVFTIHGMKGEFQEDMKTLKLDQETPLIALLLDKKKEISRHDIEDSNIPQSSKKESLQQLDCLSASLIIPMVFRDSIKGFINLGHKKSYEVFTSEDMELLQTLASQSSISLENAKSYKIIEDLNKNLEKKIQYRTVELENALLEKERTQEQLIRSESLAAIGQLVAGVAHELNNPLSSVSSLIQSTLETLEEKDCISNEESEIIDDLQFTLKDLKRAKEIVASLLDISRQTQDYEEEVNINTVVKEALTILFNQYKKYDLKIIEDLEKTIPKIKGNFAHLGQVCLNILKNAIHGVKENQGKITLRTSYDSDTDKVIFECIDTGVGIKPSISKDIFKPFFTTKEVGKGTGLGLYISHEIIKRHYGKITAFSTPNLETTFRVELPVRKPI
ncbi:MAG: ATP-binding protein [Thermodesulfobacteriota bacterium]|nr:ATP-binding protein [Thermodesulfobacteriota bacterium]